MLSITDMSRTLQLSMREVLSLEMKLNMVRKDGWSNIGDRLFTVCVEKEEKEKKNEQIIVSACLYSYIEYTLYTIKN